MKLFVFSASLLGAEGRGTEAASVWFDVAVAELMVDEALVGQETDGGLKVQKSLANEFRFYLHAFTLAARISLAVLTRILAVLAVPFWVERSVVGWS